MLPRENEHLDLCAAIFDLSAGHLNTGGPIEGCAYRRRVRSFRSFIFLFGRGNGGAIPRRIPFPLVGRLNLAVAGSFYGDSCREASDATRGVAMEFLFAETLALFPRQIESKWNWKLERDDPRHSRQAGWWLGRSSCAVHLGRDGHAGALEHAYRVTEMDQNNKAAESRPR